MAWDKPKPELPQSLPPKVMDAMVAFINYEGINFGSWLPTGGSEYDQIKQVRAKATALYAKTRKKVEDEHAAYWSPEAVALRARAVGVEMQGFHIRDDFRIQCDAFQDDGTPCGNVVGMAPLPDDHDGLCEGCRANRRPHPPRVTMDPSCVVWGPRGDAWEGS